ncbi:MAG: TrbC/VirB2 family protein [Terracidiphilus sp.]|nr:TrbC/VirB2 family protein [Terracidiphilus sp.]
MRNDVGYMYGAREGVRKGRALRRAATLAGLAIALVVMAPVVAHASATGGGSLPWETPLQTLEDSIKGPVAYGLSLLGIVASGGMLIFGGEISEFTRRIMYLVLVVGVILGAASMMTSLFTTAALVG